MSLRLFFVLYSGLFILLTGVSVISAISAPIHWYVGIEAMAEELYGPLEDIFANPSPCTFRFPPGCDSSTCIFLGKWRSEQLSTGGIVVHFLIASLALGPNRWLGVGFSADRNMPHSDAIIAGMDTSGQRLYVSDRWISGYSSPVKDHVDNIINWEWKQESNMTIFYFVRRADTGDYDQDVDLFTDMQRCLFFHFPYSGGEYSEVTDTIGKHYVTPVTIGPICSDRCEDIPSDFELVHGYCAEDFIHPANPLAPVSIADCLTLCQRLSNCLSGAYNADNSRCLLRTSTCSLSRAVDVGRNWYTYNKKSALMGPSNLGNLGTGQLPPWAVPLYPGGPTPLTLPPFPSFPQVPQPEVEAPDTAVDTNSLLPSIEASTLEPEISVTVPDMFINTNVHHHNVSTLPQPPQTIGLMPETTHALFNLSTSSFLVTEAFTNATETTSTVMTTPTTVTTTSTSTSTSTTTWTPPTTAATPEPIIDSHALEYHTEAPPHFTVQALPELPRPDEFETDAPIAAPPVDESYSHPLTGDFVQDNFEDTGTHCKGSSLGDLPENWDLQTCARECLQRPACIGFTLDRTRTSDPHLCILKAKGCENIGPHSVWSFYRKRKNASPASIPAIPAVVSAGHVDVDHSAERSRVPAALPDVESSSPLSHFTDTNEHCKGGGIDSSYADLNLEQCAKECSVNPICGGFTFDKTATSSPFKCLPKLPNCEMSGPHPLWTFYRRIEMSGAVKSEHSNALPESRSAGRHVPAPPQPSASEESRRIFQNYFNAVDGNCEGTPIVSLPVPNKEACATECYNHPKCLGFSLQIMREQPPIECQLNAQRCWHPRSDSAFRFYNRAEEMVAAQSQQQPQPGAVEEARKFVIHEGMCLDQTGEFWVDNKAQCADRCLVDSNCQGYSFIGNGNMCRLIFSFDCNGAMIFRRLADAFTTQRHQPVGSSDRSSEPKCNLPPDTGPCKANLRRWFFNEASNQCEEFVFGGCEGNGNNFIALDECEQHCAQNQAKQSSYPVAVSEPEPPQQYPAGGELSSSIGSKNIIGYKSLEGNCPGHVLQEIFQPMTIDACADRCNEAPTCAGFAFAQEDSKCVLKDGPCKNPYPHKFIYYAKM